MKTSFPSAAFFALLSIALLSSCDRSVSTVSSESGSVAVVPRFAAASVPVASRLEARLSATGQSDSVVNVVYQKGGDLELGSVSSGASFTVSMTGYDSASTSTSRIYRWMGSGSGTADNASATKYVDISTVPGPSVPTGTVSGTTLTLSSGAYYTTDGSDPRVSETVSSGLVVSAAGAVVKAASKTTSNGVTLWSDTVSWTISSVTPTKTQYTLTVAQATGGTISLSKTGSTFDSGTTVIATAAASSGYTFSGWSGACSGTSTTCTMIMTRDTSLNASFTASTGTVAAPTFSIAGGTYTSAQTVTLASTTSGASIYYTTDGTIPTSSSTLYAGALTVSASETIRAIAVKSGWTSSSVTSAVYTITPATPAKPQYTLTVTQPTGGTITPTSGTYDSGTVVTATATASSGYTFSGWSGACSGTSTTCTMIMTRDTSLNASFTASTGTVSAPTFSVAGGTYTSAQTVTLASTTSGASIYYTTDGSAPTSFSTLYGGAIMVSASETIRAIAVKSGWTSSSVTSATYMISSSSTSTSDAGPGMKLIPAGTFTMGSSTTEVSRSSGETQHSVTLSAFYMDSTDVTQGQYLAVMGVNPSYFSSCGTTCPVEDVTWFDAVLYCNARSKKANLDTVYSYTAMTGTYGNGVTALTGIAADLSKSGYRLPTEAQWEYAARGGTTTAYYWGDDTATATVSKYAWYATNASSTTHPVATKLPNPYGLYDMAGNVWQWTNDWYGTYSTTAATDPSGPSSGTGRVIRGGSWSSGASSLRSANRGYYSPDLRYYFSGFRSVRPGS